MWIDQAEQLARLVETLQRQPRVAVDTESNSLYAYQERVCLIQFSIPSADYLVDPLALRSLQPLRKIFASPEIEKVFHGAEYDLVCLRRDFDFSVTNMFDTRIASRTLGWKKTGLADILTQEFNVQLNKRNQRANWGKRPLPADQLDYARLDTHYLLPLRDRLAEALRQRGRWEEAREACELLTHIDKNEIVNGFDPEGFWRIRNARKLRPQQAAVLRELYLYREEQAGQMDRPTFKVISNKTLLAIAQKMPSDLDSLGEIPGMTASQLRRHGRGLLAGVARGRNAPHIYPPRSPRIDQGIQNRYEALHRWRKQVAQRRQVESDVILPREVLWEIAQRNPRDLASLEAIMAPLHWRFETYAAQILETLRP